MLQLAVILPPPAPGTSATELLAQLGQLHQSMNAMGQQVAYMQQQLEMFQSAGAGLGTAVQRQGTDILVLQQNQGLLQQQVTSALGETQIPVVTTPTTNPTPTPTINPTSTPTTTLPSAPAPLTTLPLAPPPKGIKLSAPKPLTKSLLNELVEDPGTLELHLDKILAYVSQPGVTFSLKEGVMQAMEATSAMNAVNSYFVEHVEKDGSGPFDPAHFKAEFIRSFTGEVRPASVIALHELMAGKVTQGSEPIAKYAERFYQRARRLPKESPQTLCLYFLNGLKPELRGLCCMDHQNNRWGDLHALVKFATAQEERENMRNSTFPAPHLSNPSAHKSQRPQWQTAGGSKRGRGATAVAAASEAMDDMDMDEPGASGTPAAAPPAAKRAKGAKPVVAAAAKSGGHGAGSSSGAHGAKLTVQLSSQPITIGSRTVRFNSRTGYTSHVLYKASKPDLDKMVAEKRRTSTSLTTEEKLELHELGMCWWCKCYGHGADDKVDGKWVCGLRDSKYPGGAQSGK